jgi:hypothetical protein
VISRLPSGPALVKARALSAAAGLALSLPALLVALSLGTGGPLDPIGPQSRAFGRGVDQLDSALSRVESSLTAASDTLNNGRQASTDASGMTASLATAMSDLADASNVQVLGVQPFAQLAPRFAEIAQRSKAVATSLTSTADSLGSTRIQLSALQADVGDLRATLRDIGAGSAAEGGFGGPSLVATRMLLALLVVWFAASSAINLLTAIRELSRTP